MPTVKILVIGTSRGGWEKGKKGDLWALVPGDFGSAEVAPAWLQLTVTDVPGATQSEAIATMHLWLVSQATAFTVSEVEGAPTGQQRYRAQVVPEVGSIANPIFKPIRDGVAARFATSGVYTSQQPGVSFDFDSSPGLPLDEVMFEITQAAQDSRRYMMDGNYVDNLLGNVAAGDPAADTQTFGWFETNVVDKLA